MFEIKTTITRAADAAVAARVFADMAQALEAPARRARAAKPIDPAGANLANPAAPAPSGDDDLAARQGKVRAIAQEKGALWLRGILGEYKVAKVSDITFADLGVILAKVKAAAITDAMS
jgi:hypothetical protein